MLRLEISVAFLVDGNYKCCYPEVAGVSPFALRKLVSNSERNYKANE